VCVFTEPSAVETALSGVYSRWDLNINVSLVQATKARTVSRGIFLLFL
jgi:hypothetical protein